MFAEAKIRRLEISQLKTCGKVSLEMDLINAYLLMFAETYIYSNLINNSNKHYGKVQFSKTFGLLIALLQLIYGGTQ